MSKTFEFLVRARGLLVDLEEEFSIGNLSFIVDTVCINGVSYKLGDIDPDSLSALSGDFRTMTVIAKSRYVENGYWVGDGEYALAA